jgi:hypothetical protein
VRTYFWNCIIYDTENTIPEIALEQAYQSLWLLAKVNPNVAPVDRVVGHPCYRVFVRSEVPNFLPSSCSSERDQPVQDREPL